jgi:DNA-binding MarR family transcriptional regulator
MPDSEPAALAEALRPVLLRLSRQLRRQSEPLGLSAIESLLLSRILLNAGIGVSELADREKMSRPAMSAHIKRMEAAGFIARSAPDPADRRRVSLQVTEAGLDAREAVRRRRNDWLAGRLATLPAEARAAVEAAIGPLAELAGEGR